MERLLVACAYTIGPRSREALCEAVHESSGVATASERLTETLDRLLHSGALVEHQQSIRVSEATREDLRRYEEATMASEERVQTKFQQAVQEHGLAERSDELWHVLETQIVLPITRYLGAQLYELLTSPTSNSRSDILSHIETLDEQYGEGIRQFFFSFIDPSDNDIRSFVLRRLNAQYAADAAALPRLALDRLAKQHAIPSRVRLMVDTNFLFSIMGLHDNPGNEEANKLLQLVRDVSSRINLQLYVLPITIEETRTVLSDISFRLSGFRGQPNLAEAAKHTNSLGLAERYFQAASESPTNLTPSDFFDPYESDLLTILRSKSVELYNTPLDDLSMDQDVIDDILELSELQKTHRRRGEKSYEANRHDMVLWHFARRERSASLDSPLEATIWVVTLDYGLMSFERRKLRNSSLQPPVCLEPAAIIQLFQFWVPSSTELDEALVGSIRQPLLFLNFGVESEQVTLRILAQLSRYGGAGDLPPNVALEILTNEALRHRISSSDANRSSDEEVVGEELLEMIGQLHTERDAARSDAELGLEKIAMISPLAETASRERSLRMEAENRLRTVRDRIRTSEERVSELGANLADRDSRIAELHDHILELQQGVDEWKEADRHKRLMRRTTGMSLLAIGISLALLLGSGLTLDAHMGTALSWICGGGLSSLTLLLGLEFSLRKTPLAESRVYAAIQWLRNMWWAFAVAVVASLVAAWIGNGGP